MNNYFTENRKTIGNCPKNIGKVLKTIHNLRNACQNQRLHLATKMFLKISTYFLNSRNNFRAGV